MSFRLTLLSLGVLLFVSGGSQPCFAEAAPAKTKKKSPKKKLSEDKEVQSSTNAFVVKRGDTLGKIAIRSQPEGGSFEQRLVAFFRANPQAFNGENMNRLLAGKGLGVPKAQEILDVKPVEAKREVRKQVVVWQEHKIKVAEAKAAKQAQEIAKLPVVQAPVIQAPVEKTLVVQAPAVETPVAAPIEIKKTQINQDVIENSGPATFEEAVPAEEAILHFEIRSYTLDGATLLPKQDVDRAMAPYIGKEKDFSDVQRALEAVEELYAKRGVSAVHVSLPEQELEQGDVHFNVIESKFGKITVKNAKLIKYVTDANALNALPAVRAGNFPRSKQIARQLKLANENPARQLNVVLKAGESDEFVDANIVVTDTKPSAWGVTYDNTGTPETGRSRIGLSYRHANLFDKDHMLSMQTQVSPEQMDRVKVLSTSYKMPFYEWGGSADFAASYSNVSSLVNATSSFQGGATILSARYNYALEKLSVFDPRISVGLDIRDFMEVKQTVAPVTVMYNELVVVPLTLTYSAQGKLAVADVGFNVIYVANIPGINKGQRGDFSRYDLVSLSEPNPQYQVLRYGANYARAIFGDWQFRTGFNGQTTNDVLISGEQIRLGGMDGVRGFSEGSEGGEKGIRGNVEFYTPAFSIWGISTRSLIFFDAGQGSTSQSNVKADIASFGFGLRSSYNEFVSFRADAGKIHKEGNDPQQAKGDGRVHFSLSATF